MTARRRITVEERRRRLGIRHRLAAPHRAADVVEAARSVVCLHATDPATVFLSARARVDGMTCGDLERAPCWPSRMCSISSCTNSPACVDGDFPCRLAVRARLMVLFSGMIDLLSGKCRVGSMHVECHNRLDRN